jgi:eukaryotic-like serine/threonine-protein kinase
MPAAEPVAAPPVVPGYTVQELLGRGGTGEVWRAVPRRGGPPVAVKVLVEGEPQRQAREAALLGALDHPHLVRLVEVVHQPRRGGVTRVALVLDLLEGGSLGALLAARGRLSPGEVVTVCAPVAAALAHVHAHGVVHGDLSPGNIVFTAEGRPVLTDLGVGRIIGETAAAEVTPAYVDPTVARGSAPGPASDVFGVAAAAFHALTGIAPWNAATPADTLVVAAHGHLPDLAELAPDAPPALLEVIGRGLSADPHDRGSAAAFALDLRHACRPEPVALTPGALSRTGPRTELTHVVPGRRPRPAPVVVELPGRVDRWRAALADHRPAVPLRVLAGTTTALVVVALTAWLAVRWGSGADPGTTVAAATAPATASPATPAKDAVSAPVDGDPVTAADWSAVVTGLYGIRAKAFATASAEQLAGVWADGSPQRAADEDHARSLAAAGERLRGFAPTVADVAVVSRTPDRVELRLSDGWAAYEVLDEDGTPAHTEPARPVTPVRAVLVRTPVGWRLDSAQRLG